MTIRSIALLAICVAAFLRAAGVAGPALSIYYSFDAPASAALVTEMQAEVDRILADAGVRVAWRALESPRNGEDFQGVVFLRFRGVCSEDPVPVARWSRREYAGQSLGRTDIEHVGSDGRFFMTVAVGTYEFTGSSPRVRLNGAEVKCSARQLVRVRAHETVRDIKVLCTLI